MIRSTVQLALGFALALALGISILPAHARADTPQPCILQLEDLPPGFEVDTPYHITTNAEVIARAGDSALRAKQLQAWGRVEGVEAIYARPSLQAFASGPVLIQSWMATFASVAGAHEAFSGLSEGAPLSAPRFGEETVASKRAASPTAAGVTMIIHELTFRRPAEELGWSALVGIRLGAVEAVADLAPALDLARKLQQRGC